MPRINLKDKSGDPVVWVTLEDDVIKFSDEEYDDEVWMHIDDIPKLVLFLREVAIEHKIKQIEDENDSEQEFYEGELMCQQLNEEK